MSNSISQNLTLVNDLFNEGKFEEALQQIKEIEQKENITREQTLTTLFYKSWSY